MVRYGPVIRSTRDGERGDAVSGCTGAAGNSCCGGPELSTARTVYVMSLLALWSIQLTGKSSGRGHATAGTEC